VACTRLVVVESPALVSPRGVSEPWYDASKSDSSLKPKGGKESASQAGETSGTKPRKLADPSSVLVPAMDTLGVVLFVPKAAKGMTRFFLKGTSSEVSSALPRGLFLAIGLRDGGASLLFLAALLLVMVFFVSRNIVSEKLPQILLGHKVIKINFFKLLGFNSNCRPVAYLHDISQSDMLIERGSLQSGRNNCQVLDILRFSDKIVPSEHSHSLDTRKTVAPRTCCSSTHFSA
jgi:hypothetical protein